jgi:hypothetical protein
MKRITGAAIAVCFAIGASAGAQTNATAPSQEKIHQETKTKQTGPGPNVKTKTETVVGTVKEYKPGEKIKVSGPGDKTYTFDLDEKGEVARVEGNIAVGQMAKIVYHKGADGSEIVEVISEASPSAQAEAAAPKVHSESTVKHTGPGPDSKMKTEVVVGTVKAYEPGKKLTVTGPKDKDYTFDLNEKDNAVIMKEGVAVGQRVKVTYTKTDSGDKITAIAPAKAHA